MLFKKKVPVEYYGRSLVKPVQQLQAALPTIANAAVAEFEDPRSAVREKLITQKNCSLLAMAWAKAHLKRSLGRGELEQRAWSELCSLAASGALFTAGSVSHLDVEEFCEAYEHRFRSGGISDWFAMASVFLETLNSGGMHGADSMQAVPIVHALGEMDRICIASFKSGKRIFKYV